MKELSATPATAHATRLSDVTAAVDSVYFLMYDGWDDELESNRWHYARRWASHLPVTLLQPRQSVARRRGAAAVAGIQNCEILPILETRGNATYPLQGLVQAAQVMEHMAERGHSRPLLWCYNPLLAVLYGAVPAVARVYHASENHFDFEGMPDVFLHELEASLRMSNLVIAVSSGVADGIRSRVPEAHLEVVTNGCDTSHYRPAGPSSAAIASARARFERVAVFGGNVNARIDFSLVERAAARNDTTLIVFVGPVGPLGESDGESWRRILGSNNVLHLGRMSPDELAAVYRSADLGFIPYRREPWIVRNGFPLKTLEMAATGLPLVASHMQPIVGLASAIAVAEDDEQFLEAFSGLSRSALTDEARRELIDVAAANDYDSKFDQVVAHVAGAIEAGKPLQTRLDSVLPSVGYESWSASCTKILNRFRASPLQAFAYAWGLLAARIPTRARRLVPAWLKDQIRGARIE